MTTLEHERMLGGKGANQSIALARAGADIRHIGATRAEDGWLRAEMRRAGVDISGVQDSDLATGHAIVTVSADGENQIMLYPGANHTIDMARASEALAKAGPADWALLQNETNGAGEFVATARERGMKIAYSAAPFDAELTASLLPQTDLLVVNEGEAAALSDMLGKPAAEAGIHLVVTRGGAGADYTGIDGTLYRRCVTPVDTPARATVSSIPAGGHGGRQAVNGTSRGERRTARLRVGAAAAFRTAPPLTTNRTLISGMPDRKSSSIPIPALTMPWRSIWASPTRGWRLLG